jgi:gamma-tubulin complex component 3
MTRKWVLEGDLEDPYQEFFISSDPNVPIKKLWYDKYSLRTEMLPSFISQDLAKKV